MDGYYHESPDYSEAEYYEAMQAFYEQPTDYRCDLCHTKREMTAEQFSLSDWNQTGEGNTACPACTLRAIDRHITDHRFNRQHAAWLDAEVTI